MTTQYLLDSTNPQSLDTLFIEGIFECLKSTCVHHFLWERFCLCHTFDSIILHLKLLFCTEDFRFPVNILLLTPSLYILKLTYPSLLSEFCTQYLLYLFYVLPGIKTFVNNNSLLYCRSYTVYLLLMYMYNHQ